MESWDIRSLPIEAHHPQVLRSDPELRSIAIHLPDGEQLGEHQTYERAYLVVASGEVDVSRSDGAITSGGPGYVWQFEPQERRTVRASGGDARIVLILAPWPGAGHTVSGQ
jgi:redox-sensitive bicupin YhaK (pirin superfamily)